MKRLSIGVQWALRYGLAFGVTLSLFMFYAYDRVERRINKQAKLVLNQEINAILAEQEIDPSHQALDTFIERRIENSDSELSLAVEVLEADGTRRRAWGFLAENRVRPPEDLLQGDDDWHYTEKEVGLEYPAFVMSSAAKDGFLQVAIHSERFAQSAGHIREVFLLAIPVLMLLTAFVGWLLARGSLRPIAAINRTAQHVHGANLEERIPTTGSGDELDELASTLNAMMERIQGTMSSLRHFTADAAHQLRTPLNALRSQLEVTLEKERTPEEYRKVLEGLEDQVAHLVDAVNGMLRLSESQAGLDPRRRVPVEIGDLLDTLLDFFTPVADEAGVALVIERPPPISVIGDPSWLHQLFANLLHNAIKYTPEGGQIDVGVQRVPGAVHVEVSDTGVGISHEEMDRIFERFHRVGGSQAEPGTGLGLTIARAIAEAHDGHIVVTSQAGRGTTFTVTLPLGDEDAETG